MKPLKRTVPWVVLFLLIAAATAIPAPLHAAVDAWSYLANAPGGRVAVLAVAPSRPRVVYASAGNGLFKSNDRGTSWKPVYLQDTVLSVAVHPNDAETVYIITGQQGHFEVSTDGGATWQEPSASWSAFGARLVTTPAEPAALYAQYSFCVDKTTDGGRTWQRLTDAPGLETLDRVKDLEADPRRSGRLYLLGLQTSGEPGGWFSTDAGDTWTTFPLSPGPVADLAVDAGQAGSLLAVNGTGSVWVTDNLGQSWRRPSQTVLPSGLSLVWVGGGTSPLFVVSTGHRLFVSRDRGRSYEEASAPLPRAHLAAAFDPSRTETFYLGLERGGVLPTADAGRHFGANALAGGDLGTPVAHPTLPGTLFAQAADRLARSFDGGRSWDLAALAPPSGASVRGAPAIGPGPQPALFAPLSDGVAVSRDRGATWSSVCPQCGLVSKILVSATDPDLVFALRQFTSSSSYRSLDGGESWQLLDFVPLAIDPVDPQTLYRTTGSFPDQRFEISSDGGAQWSDANSGLHAELAIYALAAHLEAPGRLWLGTNEGLYRSDDGAANWQRVWFESGSNDVEFLGLDPSDPDTVVALARESGAPPDLDGSRMLVTRNGGDTWQVGGIPDLPSGAGVLTGDPIHPGNFYLGSWRGLLYGLTLPTPSTCAADTTTLCLQQDRFQARSGWEDFQGRTGDGRAIPRSGDTGAFWFFNPKNVELAVKVLDGGGLNGHFWVFYGALSNVEYRLDVVDTATGEARTYYNPSRALASRGDTVAFEATAFETTAFEATALEATAFEATDGSSVAVGLGPVVHHPSLAAAKTAACSPGPTALCLNDGRFRVEVEWQDFQGGSGTGQAVSWTADTGSFWFFNDRNVELVIKVLDGRPLNGHFWVFYGALSNVGYTVTVTDTETGAAQVYDNPSGQFRSRADTAAF